MCASTQEHHALPTVPHGVPFDGLEKFLSLQEALSHLDMCMWLAKHQIHHKDYFAFEHPQGSLAWSRDSAP